VTPTNHSSDIYKLINLLKEILYLPHALSNILPLLNQISLAAVLHFPINIAST